MGGKHHGTAFSGALLQQVFDSRYAARINGGEYLIQQPKGLVGNQQARQRHPPLLTG
jgi:hypothetical protein